MKHRTSSSANGITYRRVSTSPAREILSTSLSEPNSLNEHINDFNNNEIIKQKITADTEKDETK